MSNANDTVQTQYWRSLEALAGSPELLEAAKHEFPTGAFEQYLSSGRVSAAAEGAGQDGADGVSRRRFLGLMSASVAAASTAMSGCIRKPYEKIIPFKDRPEDLIPGKPNFYASAMVSGATVLGVLVESHDGRPTKVEGNPNHPISGGATDVYAQASVLDLYAAHRSRELLAGDAPTTKAEWKKAFGAITAEASGSGGTGLGIVLPFWPSPTLERLVADVQRKLPQAKFYQHDMAVASEQAAALAMSGAAGGSVLYDVDKAEVVVSIGSDFIGTETNAVRNARLYAKGRAAGLSAGTMSRLYAVESAFTMTGMSADNRLQVKPSQVGAFAAALVAALGAQGVAVPGTEAAVSQFPKGDFGKWPAVVAKELAAKRGKSLVVAGEQEPAAVQALAFAMNSALGNIGSTIRILAAPAGAPTYGDTASLVADLNSGKLSTLFVFDANPVYTTPAALGFAAAYAKAKNRIHFGMERDETALASTWHLPTAHSLESWGDLRASDGTVSIQQPLIAPLFDTVVHPLEILAAWSGEEGSAYELVRSTWKSAMSGGFERSWRRALHDGVVAGAPAPEAAPFALQGAAVAAAAPKAASGTEALFRLDPTVLDGRYANNGWCQELPDPVTKIAWDNAAMLPPKMAESLSVGIGDMVTVSANGQSLTMAVWPTPGVATDTVVLLLGYGRKHGGVFSEGVGFDTYQLAPAAGFQSSGVTVSKASGSYEVACTQDHGDMIGRAIVREATLEEFKRDPHFVERPEVMPKDKIKSLAPEPPRNEKYKQQWGMSIDLHTCIGCNACTIACQAENNIPVVGKERVLIGREMHWIRLDRYFTGDPENPRAVSQPMPCAQCETAPCETVCPVAATAHSPEGLNDMAYNRCIGTRYCANNCPFKVRRFNYFHYTQENDAQMPLVRLQRNPDVTVRFRGVMEKCTYCVQRIQSARIEYKRHGVDVVPDGELTPACAQVCPTQAIVFGDIDDPNSRVSKEKADPRNYVLLRELNIRPRTSYLARVNNPNPELV